MRAKMNMIFGEINPNDNKFDVRMKIDGSEVTMAVDTGSDLTFISERIWRRIGSPTTSEADAYAVSANGSSMDLEGKCMVTLAMNGITVHGSVYVTEKQTNLLGKDLIPFVFSLVPNQKKGTKLDAVKADTGYTDMVKKDYPEVCRDGLGHCTKMKASLSLKNDSKPVVCKRREIPLALLSKVDDEIDRLLKLEAIEPIDYTDWAAPILIVPKANGKPRVCVDFSTGLNDRLEAHNHPLPLVSEILAKLEGCKVFTQIDLSDAYLQISVDDSSKKLLGISTHRGIFRYKRLPFGVSAAPGVFQKCMDTMLTGCKNASAYLDDIVIDGVTKEHHDENLREVLDKIREHGFTIRPEKCSFGKEKIKYLGFVMDKNGRRPDPDKVRAVREMPEPQDESSLRSFLGMANYYSEYIKDMYKLRVPLDKLLKKDSKWLWNTECAQAFKEMKPILASDLNLVHFDPSKEVILATDASEKGIGAVLAHRINGKLRPIAH